MPPASVSSVIVTPTFSHVPSTSASVHVTVLESVNGGKNKVVYEGEEQKVSSEDLEVSSIRLVLLPSGASQRFTFVLADGSSSSVLGQAQVAAEDLTAANKAIRMEREGGNGSSSSSSSSNGNNVDALAEELYAGQLSMKLSVPESSTVVFAAFADFNRSASRAAILSSGGSEVSLAATGLFSFDSLSKSCPVVGVFSSPEGRLLDYSDVVSEDHSPSFRLRVAIPSAGEVVFKVYDASSNGAQGLDSSNLLGQTTVLAAADLKNGPAAFALSNPNATALDKKLKKKNACIKIAPFSASSKTSAAAVAGLQVQVSSSSSASASSPRPTPLARIPSTPYSSAVAAGGSHAAPSASDIVIVDASGLEHKAKVSAGPETVSLNVSARNLVKLQAMSTGVAPCVALWEKNASSGSYALLAHTEPQQAQADPRFVTPLSFTLSSNASGSASSPSSSSTANANAEEQYRVDVYDVSECRVGVSSDRVGFAYLSRGALASLASSPDFTEESLALRSDKPRLQSKLNARSASVQLARAGAPATTMAQREAQRAQALQNKQAALASKKAAWASSRQAQQAAVGLGAVAAVAVVAAAAPAPEKKEEVKEEEEPKVEEPVAVAVVAAPKTLVAEEEGAGAASAAPAPIPIEDEEPVAVAAAAEPEQQQQQQQINVVPATPVAVAEKVEEPVAAAEAKVEEPVAAVAEEKKVEEPVAVVAAAPTEPKQEDHLAIGAGAALPPMAGRAAGAGSRRGSLGGAGAGAGAGSRRGSLNGSMGAIEVENTADMDDAILAEKVAQARVEEAAAIVESFHGAGKHNKVATDRHAAEADLVQAQKELEAAKARAVDAKAALAARRKARAEAEAAEAERKAKINAVRALDPSSHTVWGTRKRNSHGSSMQLSERMAAALANSGRTSLSFSEEAPTTIKDMVFVRRVAAGAATALAQVALLPNRSSPAAVAAATIYSLATSVKNVKNSGAWNPCLGLYEQGKDESSWVYLDNSEKLEGVGIVGSGEFRKHMLVESIPDSPAPQMLRFHLFNAGSKDEDLTASEDLIASGSIPLAKLLELAGEVGANGASKPVEVFLYSAGNKALSDRLKRQHASVLVRVVGSQPASEGAIEGRQTSLIVGSAPLPLTMEGGADPDPSPVAFAIVTPDSASASAAAALAAEEHAAATASAAASSSSAPVVAETPVAEVATEAAPAAVAVVAEVAAPVEESKVAEVVPAAESKPEVAEAAPVEIITAAEPVAAPAAAEVAASAVAEEVPVAAAAAVEVVAEEKPKVEEEAAPAAAAAAVEEPAAAVVAAEEPAAAAAEGEKAEDAAAGAEAEEEDASSAASPSASAGGEDKKKKKKNKKKGGK